MNPTSGDFGDLRFDKIINEFPLEELLKIAAKSLSIVQNQIMYKKEYKLKIYNYKTFKDEISEFVELSFLV